MNWSNHLTNQLNITYPIIQAPMLGVTTPEMVAAISNEGGLGSLPAGGLSPADTLALIRKTKSLTTKPFAVNLFTYDIPVADDRDVAAMQLLLEKMAGDNGLIFEKKYTHSYSYKEQIQLLIDENISVISFTFGIPDDTSIRAFKENKTVLIGTATCVKEAQLLHKKQVDLICAQGIEAGGHRGTFLDGELPQIGTMSLVPQIATKVNIPVIAAGGINDGRNIKAALSLGAAGVQAGSVSIASFESKAIASYKATVQNMADTDTVLTRAFSGRWARGVKNQLMEAIDKANITIPPYPAQNSLTTPLRTLAQKQNNKDFTNLWAGQSAGGCEQLAAADIFRKMVAETEILLK